MTRRFHPVAERRMAVFAARREERAAQRIERLCQPGEDLRRKERAMNETAKHVVVTTKHRGVFFGRFVDYDTATKVARLDDARNVVYWSRSVRGFLGLASTGPDAECRVGPPVPALMLEDVTSIASCTPAAVQQWEKAPWS